MAVTTQAVQELFQARGGVQIQLTLQLQALSLELTTSIHANWLASWPIA